MLDVIDLNKLDFHTSWWALTVVVYDNDLEYEMVMRSRE
jgi:hypothetical protein